VSAARQLSALTDSLSHRHRSGRVVTRHSEFYGS